MACGGPSKDHAYTVGEQAAQDMVKILKDKYHVGRPFGTSGFDQKSQAEWDALVNTLTLTVQEMVWTDHAASF